MSKAKDEYSKQVAMISFTSHYSTGPIVNYVTELEKKEEMFDEMVNLLSYSATITRCFPDAMLRDLTEDLKAILERAKKIQEAQK